MRDVWIVDEDGATFVFYSKEAAEKGLVSEAWTGAVHLSIAHDTIPDERATGGDVPDNDAVEYVMSHCTYGNFNECDQ